MKLKLEIELAVIDKFECNDIISRIYYPNEGNKIQIIKGLNKLEFCEALLHEVGHLFDWYISNGNQSKQLKIREKNAEIIESLAIHGLSQN